MITLLAVICLVLYSVLHPAGWTGYLFLLMLPLLAMHLKSVYWGEGRALDSQLKFLSITTLLIALLLGFGQLLSLLDYGIKKNCPVSHFSTPPFGVLLYKQRESWKCSYLREESPAPPLFIEEVAAKVTEEFLK